MRVRPRGNHEAGTIVGVVDRDVYVRCDCGHVGGYDPLDVEPETDAAAGRGEVVP
jgi:hypothetical protein